MSIPSKMKSMLCGLAFRVSSTKLTSEQAQEALVEDAWRTANQSGGKYSRGPDEMPVGVAEARCDGI